MKLILVRHGETRENVLNITQGQLNSQLNELGIAQAKMVAERLKSEKIDFAYTSDLDRAADTAREIITFHPNLPLISCKDLREQHKGIFEGMNKSVINESAKNAELPYYKFRPFGGESVIEVYERIKKFLNMLKKEHNNDTVLIVTHGTPITCFLLQLLNKKFDDYKHYCQIKPASVSIIDIDSENNEDLLVLNCSKHLEEDLKTVTTIIT